MEDPEVASGLFAIQLSSDDEDGDNNNGTSSVQETTKADRTGQSEAQFQHVKQTYRVKVESGEVSYTGLFSLDLRNPCLPRAR